MTRISPLRRALLRAGGKRSEDDRDVARALRRQIMRASRRDGYPQPVQAAGQPLEAEGYAHWRKRALRRGTVSSAPELDPGRYALVLFTLDPDATEQFTRHGAAAQLTPPTVGAFLPTTDPAVGLAGTLAGWLRLHPRRVALAPPLLYTSGGWRVAQLGIDWELAPQEPPARS